VRSKHRAFALPANADTLQSNDPLPPARHAPADAAFTWPVRVYYEDTDAAGLVYYASYLRFMERARTEALRALGFEQSRVMREHGVAFVVRSAAIDFLRAAALDDELGVGVSLEQLGASLIVFAQRIVRGEELLASARVKVACVRIGQLRPARIPAAIREQLERFRSCPQA